MIKLVNAYRREVNFNIEDHVQLNTKYQNTTRPSLKLDNNNSSPFKITKKVGNSFQLELLASMKINLVILLDKLRKSTKDLLLGQVNTPKDLVEIISDINIRLTKSQQFESSRSDQSTRLSRKAMRKKTQSSTLYQT